MTTERHRSVTGRRKGFNVVHDNWYSKSACEGINETVFSAAKSFNQWLQCPSKKLSRKFGFMLLIKVAEQSLKPSRSGQKIPGIFRRYPPRQSASMPWPRLWSWRIRTRYSWSSFVANLIRYNRFRVLPVRQQKSKSTKEHASPENASAWECLKPWIEFTEWLMRKYAWITACWIWVTFTTWLGFIHHKKAKMDVKIPFLSWGRRCRELIGNRER